MVENTACGLLEIYNTQCHTHDIMHSKTVAKAACPRKQKSAYRRHGVNIVM